MGKLENKKNHDHLFVDCIKYGILGLVLCAPLFSVLAKTCYVTFNKNAENSYYGETINEKEYKTPNQYTLNEKYNFQNNGYNTTFPETSIIYLTDIKNYTFPNISANLQTALDNNTVYQIKLENWDNHALFKFMTQDNQTIQNYNGNLQFQFDFTLLSYTTNNTLMNEFVYKIEYNNYSYLDNAFYYAIEELNEQPVFNWTKNTGMYTVIDGMTTGLELGYNNVLALLLTYWVMNVLIFSIFNIILMVFDKIWCIFYKE